MAQRLRVASVPAGHPYVERVMASSDLTVQPDPRPVGAPEGQWWPPVVLAPGWIDEHRDQADVLHLHFGLESFTPSELVDAVEAAHRVGWPVVQTVHDLLNPQLANQTPHLAGLDALVPIVDAVVTLTPGAAHEIETRWHRRAVVLPHPRLLPDDLVLPRGVARDVPVIGVHLKDLRPNVDGLGAVRLLLVALDGLSRQGVPATLEVHLHRQVRDQEQRDAIRALCSGRGDVVLLEHDRFDDEALAHALAHLDACLLPYRAGTHSGWLELCWDLGVAVAAPEVGFFAEQHDDPTIGGFAWTDGGAGLVATLAHLLRSTPPAGSDARRRLVAERLRARAQRDAETATAHDDLYRSLLPSGAAR
ncbi:hypothetical protein [Frondihabitans australicus]|uniref:D-inositol 3-phosphate glycosyltransferase n=1 Tax=Frondihabitans australicus TaxID=386892 RepID=A0A495II77_9MICO|nr:hypothetical protein [Frondihabitans australicus]RKR74815.1 hypothetical protein C8E83_1946 [Frondihabitans australicus]